MNKTIPEVTRCGTTDMSVCVPSDWKNRSVETFANTERPRHKWKISGKRSACSTKPGFCHYTLEVKDDVPTAKTVPSTKP